MLAKKQELKGKGGEVQPLAMHHSKPARRKVVPQLVAQQAIACADGDEAKAKVLSGVLEQVGKEYLETVHALTVARSGLLLREVSQAGRHTKN